MKRLKKIVSAALALTMVFTLGACSSKKSPEEFDTYINSLPTEFMENDDMNLEFTFTDARNFGFKDELLTLPFNTKEDYDASSKQMEDILTKLGDYNYKSLSTEQKLTYDVLKDYAQRHKDLNKYFMMDNNYLGSFIGFQAQLPLLLNEYTFDRKQDLDSYFNILETSEATFKQYADNEKERQKAGVGMSKTALDKVIEQCKNFTKDTDSFLIATNNKKIDALTFLNATEKEEAKAKNTDLLKNKFLKAYKTLGDELSTITPTNTKDLGLASLPDGKEYYEYLLKSSTGIDMSVPDIKAYLESQQQKYALEFMALLSKNPDLEQKMTALDLTDENALKYSNFTSVEQTIDYLHDATKKDYPAIDKLNYDVTTVPDAMKDNFSPAAYLQGKIDAGADATEHIYVNGPYKQNLFDTIAHEGYPGHMYQHSYFKSLKYPTIRYMLDYSGYSEGWATYVEYNAWQYTQTDDKALMQAMSINSKLTATVIALSDIGIHYDGWDRAKFASYIKENFGDSLEQKDIDEQYNLSLETPGNYLKYYLPAMKYQDMQDAAKEKLGATFDTSKFNEVLLKTGPSSLSILQANVDAYVDSVK